MGEGRIPLHPKISAPTAPMNMKLYMHVVFGLYFQNITSKLNLTAWKLPELIGLNQFGMKIVLNI